MHGPVENLALLVADVEHRASRHAEIVDHPDRVVEVAGPRIGEHVPGEGLLAAIPHLPVAGQVATADEHAQNRPSQERKPPAADLQDARQRVNSNLRKLGTILTHPRTANPAQAVDGVSARGRIGPRSSPELRARPT